MVAQSVLLAVAPRAVRVAVVVRAATAITILGHAPTMAAVLRVLTYKRGETAQMVSGVDGIAALAALTVVVVVFTAMA